MVTIGTKITSEIIPFDKIYIQRAKQTLGLWLLHVASRSQSRYLSGPRPQILGVKTGQLRQSIGTQIIREGDRLVGRVGSGVKKRSLIYAYTHEFGMTINAKTERGMIFKIGDRWFRKMQVRIPPRPFLRPPFYELWPKFYNMIKSILGNK